MKKKHQKTLESIFRKPTSGSISFADIEALVTAAGGTIRKGEGSRVAFEMGKGSRLYLHRQHPHKEAKKYQVEDIRDWLVEKGVAP